MEIKCKLTDREKEIAKLLAKTMIDKVDKDGLIDEISNADTDAFDSYISVCFRNAFVKRSIVHDSNTGKLSAEEVNELLELNDFANLLINLCGDDIEID